MEVEHYDQLIDQLKVALKNTTHERFSEKIGIGTKTLKRALSGQRISEKCLMRIFVGVHGRNWVRALHVLVEQFPDNTQYRKLLEYHQSLKVDDQFDESTLPLWMESDTSFRIMNLLCRKDGVNFSVIERHFGLVGLEFLNKAQDAGKVEILESGAYRATNWRFTGYSGEVAKAFAVATASGYNTDTFGTKESAIYHNFGELSGQGFFEAKELIMRFGREFQALEEKHPGKIRFSLSTVMIKIISDANPELN